MGVAFDLERKLWSEISMASNAPPGPRFGHAAAIPKGSSHMYVLGGYTLETQFSNEFFRCDLSTFDGELECEDITFGCADASSSGVPDNLYPRYSHTMFANDYAVYVYGGSSLAQVEGYHNVFKFAVESCSWEEIGGTGDVGRYEHGMAYLDGYIIVQGGHARELDTGAIDD